MRYPRIHLPRRYNLELIRDRMPAHIYELMYPHFNHQYQIQM